ncbi:MAG TPA: type IVB secretion system protein IcmH/DotU [Blastocatellia bacterium]|jgi:type VI secretion system protein ImpK|nr:type IVB secretion system protein IcmH/DotU [Blastocatellia bacterium]
MMEQARNRLKSENELVDLATPVFQLVLRLKSEGLTPPGEELRRSIDAMLRQIEQAGAARGYKEDQLENARFALAAFVDEAVLGGQLKEEWEKYPLQLEYFREALAGTKFFERLDALLKRAETEADVVEIYYLCLLLGFKGKYDVFLEDQLPGEINKVTERLRQVGRLRGGALSPHWKVTDQPEPPPPEPELPRWVIWAAVGSVGMVALVYTILNWILIGDVNDFMQGLLK